MRPLRGAISAASTISTLAIRIKNVDQINTTFEPVYAIDACPFPAYAIDIIFFSNKKFPVIMSNRKTLISHLFFLNVDRVHEY